MVSIPVIAHFAAATFFGNVAFSAMGFGMAICYLFVYQIGALAGLVECCGLPGLKYAVFIQTIGMAVIQPIVLWNVNLRKNFRWDLLLTMLPMQFLGAPVGQFLQVYTPAEILKIVVGVATILVAGWQIFNIIKNMRLARSNSYTVVEIQVTEDDKKAEDKKAGDGKAEVNSKVNCTLKPDDEESFKSEFIRRRRSMGHSISAKENDEDPKDNDWKDKQNMVLDYITEPVTLPVTLTGNGVDYITLSSGYHKDMEERLQAEEDMHDMKHKVKLAVRSIITQMWPIQPRIVWMGLAGLVSGFLGGLIGVRSPPLIIFFFIYEFAPLEVKANGAVIATANTLVRIIMYVCNPPPPSYPHASWFVKEDIYLYLTVSVVAVTACPLGLYLTKYLAKKGYKLALTALLIVNGITMITTAAMDLM